ncbi:hypothetical protein KP77_24970 [Jeotgalibacillus alimentarius]|uniref:Phage tail protein n=1 Tax=Jeotgalibacillus alimentarius TaxID=135826 RepID=A0A0C2RYQ7_9BACL|nr:phage tail domain-containing protein [Jeotgalibacillus alimentarius]KIL46929.1 hypothetical protein KP77_24970 [Jeotgalibacillus alimentarius]
MSLDMRGGGNIAGFSFDALGLSLIRANVPILPSTRQFEEELPGLDGAIDLGTEYTTRPIELVLDISADNEAEYQSKLAMVALAFDPSKGVQELVLGRQSGKVYFVKYNGSLPIERIGTYGEFTLPLKAFDPFAYSVTKSTTPLELGQGYVLGQGLSLGMTYTYDIDQPYNLLEVVNAGTYRAFPIIKIVGIADTILLKNETTGKELLIDVTMGGTSELTIDMKNSTVYLNSTNRFDDTSGDFFVLQPGVNSLSVMSDQADYIMEIEFRHTYLY